MRECPSPLRYPGGKTQLYRLVSQIIEINKLKGSTYIEPFAGGAGLALRLLLEGDVSKIIINDFDFHIYAFWHSVLHESDSLCKLILRTPIEPEQWKRQREIYKKAAPQDLLALGFSTFFLNRTNISGVLTAGMIGGLNQQGRYKINARYAKNSLVRKIQVIAERNSDIFLFHDDAIDFMRREEIKSLRRVFINCDPPYVQKGASLYKNSFTEKKHRDLAQVILKCRKKWIVTYDNCPLIHDLYHARRMGEIGVFYSARSPRLARECIIFNDNVKIPENIQVGVGV